MSAHTGKQPCINTSQVSNFLPIETNGHQEWEPWQLQDALLPGVSTELAEFAAPTHTLTIFSTLIDILCIFNDHRDHPIEQYQVALNSWYNNIPDHIHIITGVDEVPADTLIPPNIINLYLLPLMLEFVISRTILPSTVTDWKPPWQKPIHAADALCNFFGQEVLPPPINLLRNILPEKYSTEGQSIGQLVSRLSIDSGGHEVLPSLFQLPANANKTKVSSIISYITIEPYLNQFCGRC